MPAAARAQEDAEVIGDTAEVHAVIEQCQATGCDLAFLGVVGNFFASHAYWLTPRAAVVLLEMSHERCNARKADWQMRYACLGAALGRCLARSTGRAEVLCNVTDLTRESPPRLRCLKPQRILWMRDLLAFGPIAQNHKALTPYLWSDYKLLVSKRDAASSQKVPANTARAIERLKSQPAITGAPEHASSLREQQCARLAAQQELPL